MKKILFILIILVNIFLISSCSFRVDGDGQVARKKILELIDYIENDNKEQIIELFSPLKKNEITNLQSQVDDLCEYYSGTYASINANGLGSYESIEYGKSVKYFEMFYDIHTSDSSYHFSILWYIKDDYNPDYIGIWSLYIEKYEGNNSQNQIDNWDDGITLL